MLPDDRLLFNIHHDDTLNLHAIDIESCEMLSVEIPVALDEIKLNDVEGIAWPVDACIR